jgi:hypothetical protein
MVHFNYDKMGEEILTTHRAIVTFLGTIITYCRAIVTFWGRYLLFPGYSYFLGAILTFLRKIIAFFGL